MYVTRTVAYCDVCRARLRAAARELLASSERLVRSLGTVDVHLWLAEHDRRLRNLALLEHGCSSCRRLSGDQAQPRRVVVRRSCACPCNAVELSVAGMVRAVTTGGLCSACKDGRHLDCTRRRRR